MLPQELVAAVLDLDVDLLELLLALVFRDVPLPVLGLAQLYVVPLSRLLQRVRVLERLDRAPTAQGVLVVRAVLEDPGVPVAPVGQECARLLTAEVAPECGLVCQGRLTLLLDDLELLVVSSLLLQVPLLQRIEEMRQMLLVLLELFRIRRLGARRYLAGHLVQLRVILLVAGAAVEHELVLVGEHDGVRGVAREHGHDVLHVRRRRRGGLPDQRGRVAVARVGGLGGHVRVGCELVRLVLVRLRVASRGALRRPVDLVGSRMRQ